MAAQAQREIEREACEPLPDPWAMAADVVRAELADRERRRQTPPAPLHGLSMDAALILVILDRFEQGEAFYARLAARAELTVHRDIDLASGLDELYLHGLIEVRMAANEDGDLEEPIVTLRRVAEVPEPPGDGED